MTLNVNDDDDDSDTKIFIDFITCSMQGTEKPAQMWRLLVESFNVQSHCKDVRYSFQTDDVRQNICRDEVQ